jgi:hypothetical protein
MSTFGKKSLVWWDYHKRDRETIRRFNSTPKDIQLQILEKWYPIGMLCGLHDGRFNYKLVEYVEFQNHYGVKVELIAENSILDKMNTTKCPLTLIPDPNYERLLKRQSKLQRIL